MNPEKPLFLRNTALRGLSFASSELRLPTAVGLSPDRGGAFSLPFSPAVKLADCFSVGDMVGYGVEWASGGGGGRRMGFWYPEAEDESRWDRIPMPSKGAPRSSADVFSLNGRDGLEKRLWLFLLLAEIGGCRGVVENSTPDKSGDARGN